MSKFEAGKVYRPNDCGYQCIRVLRRTPKCIVVEGTESKISWRMVVRVDENGVEYATDSSEPQGWRYIFTYRADREEKD